MPRISRRDILRTFASSAALLAGNPAHALTCEVNRARTGDVSTKSYNCQLGEGKALTATFMRISDVLADSAGRGALPPELTDFENMVASTHLIQNEPLRVFQDLMDRFSFPIESSIMTVEFDGRGSSENASASQFAEGLNNRYRTLGYWDEKELYTLPFFPMPDLLQRAFQDTSFDQQGFLRFADSSDFINFNDKLQSYLGLWQSQTGETSPPNGRQFESPKSLDLLDHIQAGSVDRFLPLFFSSDIYIEGCSDSFTGGCAYVPPALYVDIAVCKNDGAEPIQIDDFFGATETSTRLRTYVSTTPDGARPLGWAPTQLAPGESVIAVQRLLFSAQPGLNYMNDRRDRSALRADRAVFGRTELPKGVIVDGQEFPFDGRSHNTLIFASVADGACCPYLYFWCDTAREWVSSGKVMVNNIGSAQTGEDAKTYPTLRSRFKLVEQEHERTFLSGMTRVIELSDGTTVEQVHPDCDVILDIGQSHEVSFELPANVAPQDVVATTLKMRGYYDKYTNRNFQERRAALECIT